MLDLIDLPETGTVDWDEVRTAVGESLLSVLV